MKNRQLPPMVSEEQQEMHDLARVVDPYPIVGDRQAQPVGRGVEHRQQRQFRHQIIRHDPSPPTVSTRHKTVMLSGFEASRLNREIS
jgi:hypothetical protein